MIIFKELFRYIRCKGFYNRKVDGKMRVNEENFIELLKEKNENALYFVVDKYHGIVKGVTLKVLGPLNKEGLVDECINDIYMQVFNNAHKFLGKPEDFKKWIGTVSKYKAIDYYRKNIKNTQRSLDEIVERGGIPLEDEYISLENKNEIIECINSLGKPDSEIFLMKYFLGYNCEEIGEKLNLSKAAVNSRLSRGKKKLRLEISSIREVI